MLNPTGNYIYQLADPDINFDWETIEQVVKYIYFFSFFARVLGSFY
jgi:hypothetical protein